MGDVVRLFSEAYPDFEVQKAFEAQVKVFTDELEPKATALAMIQAIGRMWKIKEPKPLNSATLPRTGRPG